MEQTNIYCEGPVTKNKVNPNRISRKKKKDLLQVRQGTEAKEAARQKCTYIQSYILLLSPSIFYSICSRQQQSDKHSLVSSICLSLPVLRVQSRSSFALSVTFAFHHLQGFLFFSLFRLAQQHSDSLTCSFKKNQIDIQIPRSFLALEHNSPITLDLFDLANSSK